MKNAIVAFLMSVVVASVTAWVQNKVNFPATAVDQLKVLAAEGDSANLTMKVLGGDVDRMAETGMKICSAENKGATDPCVAKGVEFLKGAMAKREQIAKTSADIQAQAGTLQQTIDMAPFSGSVKPMMAPMMDRLKAASSELAQSRGEVDFSLASFAAKLSGIKTSEETQKVLAGEVEAMKAGGVGAAFEKVQMVAELGKKR